MSNVEKFQCIGMKVAATILCASGLTLLSACSHFSAIQDPCALANRDASFSTLVDNSISNAYNACLEKKRGDILREWWEK
jgi:hypothetical protein